MKTLSWDKIQQGDEEAFRQLYEQYADLLYGYGMKIAGAVCHAIGEVHQLTVEAGACRVGVLGDGLAFDVVGRARVRRAFRLVELDAYVSHFCLLFL